MEKLNNRQILITETVNGWILNIPNPNYSSKDDKERIEFCFSEDYSKKGVKASKVREDAISELLELLLIYLKDK